jgi:hypothetical protein
MPPSCRCIRFARLALGLVLLTGLPAGRLAAAELGSLAADPLGIPAPFQPVAEPRLNTAAAKLREAIGPLRRLLDRSRSGANWRKYLDWPELERQAASGSNADVDRLAAIYKRLDAGENGLEMPQFAAVRRAVGAYLEAAGTASNPEADKVYAQRLDRLAAAVVEAAASGTPQPLDPVGPILARLEESGQGLGVVSRLRRTLGRPNLYLQVDESLLARSVNRSIDETAPIRETLLGTRVSGSGRTTGFVSLDFQPATDRAVVDLVLDATNHSLTRGSQGPVTVRTIGTTQLDARKRIFIDEQGVTAAPVEAQASVSTTTAGIDVHKRIGQRLIRRIASRKVAEMQPQARAISQQRARERVRSQFEAQTADAVSQAASDYQTKFRQRLTDRGWYPEMLHFNTDHRRLFVTARKSLADQLASFSSPPAVDPAAVLAARMHESFFNNLAEQELGGRTLTKERLEAEMKKAGREMPAALEDDADQPPWSITFAKRKPVEVTAGDGTIRLTVHGSGYTSGDREFPAMDVWASYRIEPAAGRVRLFRDGDVQIYPPGFVPGGPQKLSVQETSLRRILQKRFNKVFDEVVEVEPLQLPGQLERAGPLPMQQLVARKDGWIAAGWRKPDRVISGSIAQGGPFPGEVIVEGPVISGERIISEEPVVHGGVVFESAALGEAAAATLVLSQP